MTLSRLRSSRLDMLVVDGADLFAVGGLGACLEGAWEAYRVRSSNGAFLPAARGGRIVYLAPGGRGRRAYRRTRRAPDLENLARTLSVEWARHTITVVTIALGNSTARGRGGGAGCVSGLAAGATSRLPAGSARVSATRAGSASFE